MSYRLEPLRDRVVLLRAEEEKMTAGGLYLADTAQKDKPMEAEVVAVGPGKRDDSGNIVPMAVHVGDRVLIGKWVGTETKVNGEDLLVVREEEILGILRTIEAMDH